MHFPISTGFESALIHGTAHDILDLTQHTEQCESDINLMSASGITSPRYPVQWHRVEAVRGTYDWSWTDRALGYLKQCNMSPNVDLLHFTSFPTWLTHGYLNDDFVEAYARFVLAFADRYPWVEDYTLVNEPLVAALFCGETGVWYPYHRREEDFVKILLKFGKIICSLSAVLYERGCHVVHVDTCEHHTGVGRAGKMQAQKCNARRFVMLDLILGRVVPSSPQFSTIFYKQVATEKELEWFLLHPAKIALLGLDYYAHSEMRWDDSGMIPEDHPLGFAAVAGQYVKHAGLPVMLSETNIRGSHTDRMSWLKFMLEQSEVLATQCDFRGFTWYPFIDSTDWDSLITRANGNIDPQGIYYLTREVVGGVVQLRRNASELSQLYAALAHGRISANDIPAYELEPGLKKAIAPFLPLMGHWNWKKPKIAT